MRTEKTVGQIIRFSLFGWVLIQCVSAIAETPRWIGRGHYRILVRVEPRDLRKRGSDEMPARVHFDANDVRTHTGNTGKIDLASIQVAHYDPKSGEPVNYGK